MLRWLLLYNQSRWLQRVCGSNQVGLYKKGRWRWYWRLPAHCLAHNLAKNVSIFLKESQVVFYLLPERRVTSWTTTYSKINSVGSGNANQNPIWVELWKSYQQKLKIWEILLFGRLIRGGVIGRSKATRRFRSSTTSACHLRSVGPAIHELSPRCHWLQLAIAGYSYVLACTELQRCSPACFLYHVHAEVWSSWMPS
jgi:hypothetical protein